MSAGTDSGGSAFSLGDISQLTIAEWHALGDAPVRQLLAEFRPLFCASEVAIWAKDPEAEQLVALFDTTGPNGGFELKVKQPLKLGIVSDVYRGQKAYLDRSFWGSKKQSSLVDTALNQVTQHQICVPFAVAGMQFGVMSAVQLTDAKHANPKRWGFDEDDLTLLSLAALALGQALERSYLKSRFNSVAPPAPQDHGHPPSGLQF